MGPGSQGLLPTEGVLDTDVGDPDVNKEGPGGFEVEGPDIDIRDGATPADEEFAPTDVSDADEEADINFRAPGFSC